MFLNNSPSRKRIAALPALLLVCACIALPFSVFAAPVKGDANWKDGAVSLYDGDTLVLSEEIPDHTDTVKVHIAMGAHVTIDGGGMPLHDIAILSAGSCRLTLRDVHIDNRAVSDSPLALKGESVILLSGENQLHAGSGAAGVFVSEESTLLIKETVDGGKLTVSGGLDGAGIGAMRGEAVDRHSFASTTVGKITIESGVIVATGTVGIGGNGADIQISGGDITAQSRLGAGIGGGMANTDPVSVHITGDAVISAADGLSGIGASPLNTGDIRIRIDGNARVKSASGGLYSAAIGSGGGSQGNLHIHLGDKAILENIQSLAYGSPIGAGSDQVGDTHIVLSGSSIVKSAKCEYGYAAGIGGGNANCGSLTVDIGENTVVSAALSESDGAGIGGGYGHRGDITVNISGSARIANANVKTDAAGIGAASRSVGSLSVNISGNAIVAAYGGDAYDAGGIRGEGAGIGSASLSTGDVRVTVSGTPFVVANGGSFKGVRYANDIGSSKRTSGTDEISIKGGSVFANSFSATPQNNGVPVYRTDFLSSFLDAQRDYNSSRLSVTDARLDGGAYQSMVFAGNPMMPSLDLHEGNAYLYLPAEYEENAKSQSVTLDANGKTYTGDADVARLYQGHSTVGMLELNVVKNLKETTVPQNIPLAQEDENDAEPERALLTEDEEALPSVREAIPYTGLLYDKSGYPRASLYLVPAFLALAAAMLLVRKRMQLIG